MALTDAQPVRFGSFELDVRLRELRRGTTCTRLQEQPFEILRLMLERPGDVVTREQLRQRLWPDGTFVDFEHSLNAAVKRLRAALGDDAENPRFVETLPRRGYRFIAKLDDPAADAQPALTGPLVPRLRLAVLPFTNLSEDSAQEYFSDGLTEEMIAQLGGLCRGRVAVLARWSSMVFKGSACSTREIADALRADYLLEGSVRRVGDRVRITARLIETAGETHLWSENYTRDLGDHLSVQTDVAERIARSLAMELVPDERTSGRVKPDPASYQAYLKGRYFWNKSGDEGLREAVVCYERALETAPSFGPAHAALARAYIAGAEYYYGMPRQALRRAQVTAERAIVIDPTLYEAHLALADTRRMLDWDCTAAESSYSRAIALNPSYESAHRGYATMLSALSRHGEAVRESERACELDPMCLTVGTTAAWVRYAAGDYQSAIEHCRNTIDLDPEFMLARRVLGAAYLQAGRDADAVAEFESAAARGDVDPVVLAWLAHAKAVTGARGEAVALIAQARALESERYVPAYHLALAYTGLGSLDAAFDALDQACLDRDPVLLQVGAEPRFEPLRRDPRYAALLERIGLGREQ